MQNLIIPILLVGLDACGEDQLVVEESSASVLTTQEELGKALFLDTNLSLDREMSCSTCHNPDHAFIDNRDNSVDGAVSTGQDAISFGDRNSPMISYSSFIPDFSQAGGNITGGLFLDGRASDLVEQAKGPFLNTVEMQMPDEQSVVSRVMENDEYVALFKGIYGEDIFEDTDEAFEAIAETIAEFEKSDDLSPFDSRLDSGNLTAQEIRGQNLFRQVQCIRCHSDNGNNALFTNFTYENLGIAENSDVRAINGVSIDEGLFGNPNITANNQKGKFRVPSLRNVGVTAPYMHNGIFKELKTVVHFYNTRDVSGAINPETGVGWGSPEVSNAIVTQDVGDLGLSDSEEDDIVAFLKALTDSKYEDL